MGNLMVHFRDERNMVKSVKKLMPNIGYSNIAILKKQLNEDNFNIEMDLLYAGCWKDVNSNFYAAVGTMAFLLKYNYHIQIEEWTGNGYLSETILYNKCQCYYLEHRNKYANRSHRKFPEDLMYYLAELYDVEDTTEKVSTKDLCDATMIDGKTEIRKQDIYNMAERISDIDIREVRFGKRKLTQEEKDRIYFMKFYLSRQEAERWHNA